MRRRWADERHPVRFHHLGEPGVLRQEAVARMDRVRPRDGRGAQDGRDVQVAVPRRRRADAHAFVRQPHVHRLVVGRGMHGNRRDAQLPARPLDPQRDLAAVGDQDLVQHATPLLDHEQRFAIFHRRAGRDQDPRYDAGAGRLDLVERLHGLDQQHGLPAVTVAPGVTKAARRVPGTGRRCPPSGWSARPGAPPRQRAARRRKRP